MPQLQGQNTQNVPELLLQTDLLGSKTEPKSNMEKELPKGWRDGEEAAARFVTTVTLLQLKIFSASHTQTQAANVATASRLGASSGGDSFDNDDDDDTL